MPHEVLGGHSDASAILPSYPHELNCNKQLSFMSTIKSGSNVSLNIVFNALGVRWQCYLHAWLWLRCSSSFKLSLKTCYNCSLPCVVSFRLSEYCGRNCFPLLYGRLLAWWVFVLSGWLFTLLLLDWLWLHGLLLCLSSSCASGALLP